MLVVGVMVVVVEMDARLGHCSAATRDGQRHISRLRDCFLHVSVNELELVWLADGEGTG